ncbi:collagen alpha-6(VI) chain isoform X1 [Platichthys flesus]|uniref:collagen alpha-6(VI) chain isoform X1 n=1 Tax=Platichthys flesus TaxID=8260 RepID=UPI002DB72BBD|nr:collagen alpha-6(VI) chain isoform X1 [Platichthys flesus]
MEGRRLLLGLVLAACFCGGSAQRTVCTQEAVADIIFMVDGSWSIGTLNFEQIRQFLFTLVNSFDVGPDHVRIGLVQYSTTPRTEFLLNSYQNKDDILEYISKLPYMGGGTQTGQGLDFMMREHFTDKAGSRANQKVPQIAVVITDGKSQDNVESHAQDLKRKGIVLYAIGIKEADEEQLKEIASEPHSQHVYSVSDFTALQEISQSIVQTLCTTVEEAKRQLLQLSKECVKATVADIVFLVDGSSSIGKTQFKEAQRFLHSVVEGLDIGPDKVRVGLAQYNEEQHSEFLLKDHEDKQSLLEAIDSFPYREGSTYTGKAIDFLRETYFTEEAGRQADQRVPRIAVIITDGDSSDDVKEPAKKLRDEGVIVFAIGVGQANLEELGSIASRPLKRFRLTINSYEVLKTHREELLRTVCVSMEDQRQALAERFSDIFFLVDSGVSGPEFQQVRTNLVKLVTQLNVGASSHRIGLAQYAENTSVEFHLNKFETKRETLAAVKSFRKTSLKPNTPRNLGSALQFASKRFFTHESGGRADQGYRQFLVVLSGKDSDDPVYKGSREIKAEGVTVIGVNLKASSDMGFISTGSYAYDSIADAVSVLKTLSEIQYQEAATTGDCRAATLADIVFIVDDSSNIGPDNFRLVRDFLYATVSGFDVAPDKVRVGIVMNSNVPSAQVYLKSFDTRKALLNFIRILPYHGGDTHTGAALNFTREHLFIKANGGRRQKGVQRVVVVITLADSKDDVSRAASLLRRDDVTVYSVGVQNANKSQLVEMASHPASNHIFTVDSFAKLKSQEQNLQKFLCFNILRESFSVEARRTGIKEGCVQTDEADIFFLIDHSGSIYPSDFNDMKKFIIEFLNTFRIGKDHVRVGVAKYAASPELEFDLDKYENAMKLEKAVEEIKHVGGGTETGKALKFMSPLFENASRSRGHKVQEFLVVITDGKSTDGVKVPAEKLRAEGVIIYAIGVKKANETELLQIAGDKQKRFYVKNFEALKLIKDDIITDICSTEVCKDRPSDLIFLIDSSGSINELDYVKMKEFMKSVINKTAVRQNDVHVGVMQFSSTPQLEFKLNEFFTKEEMSKEIDNMVQMKKRTHTGEAITVVSQYFDASSGGRPDLRQTLVVVTDGEAQDGVKGPAEALRAKGVVIYAIGVMEANTTQLLEISGSPEKMYAQRNFDALKALENQLVLEMCEPERDCKKTKQADLIFLVDGSRSIYPPDFETMQRFMESVVNLTTVGKDLTRFGVIMFSNDPESIFTLNQYSSKQEVRKAISALTRPDGETYTGKALAYSIPFFEAVNGGRAALRVPQILMVITDGKATDPANLAAPSEALREKGIRIFSVGVGKANVTELEIMAGDKSRVFYVDKFEALETLYKNISGVLCVDTKPVCEKQQADLVFVLDQSESILDEEYSLLKNFTAELVKSFNISKGLAHVGLGRFNHEFKHEFYLNNFYTEKAVVRHIMDMKQIKGGTKIGMALNFSKEYFTASRGSRVSEGISQNLVLITDGDSQDSVVEAAEELRVLGIEVFVIGIGKINHQQLLSITDSKKVFIVENFGSLEKIKQKVTERICENTPGKPEGCTIDVAMGFDISRNRNPGDTLISGHPKLEKFLPVIATYVSSVKDICCVNPSTVRTSIGFRLVGQDGRTLDDTSFELHSQDIVNKVKRMTFAEPTKFNTALLKSFKEKFQGSNAGVKVLVIFSDGLDEDVMTLKKEAEQLRLSGVNALLTVALEGARDPAQLQMVEFGRGFGYKLPLSIGMSSVGSSVLKQIDTVSNKECCGLLCKCSGNEGIRGSWGPPGSKGASGQKGYLGFPGEEGGAGERGRPGPSGPQGLEGCSGLRGPKGFRGIRGNRGEDGEDGLDGVNGEQGVTGNSGGLGDRGHPGNPGIPGIRGEAGLKGQRGLRGDPGEPGADNRTPGPRGESGNPGSPGPAGLDGRAGEGGGLGNPGPNGRRGPLGEKGASGRPGDAGVPGSPGASGIQGPRGVRGQPGPRGGPGLPGPQGGPGAAGAPGSVGQRGANGQKGQPGDSGGPGVSGSQGPRGMPGQDGRDGHGPPGLKGVKGDAGFPGYPGLQGEDGLQGPKGSPGPKGNRGRGGNSGRPGGSGGTGEPGYSGHRGQRGLPGGKGMTECQLVTYIRDNCACSFDRSQCPAYPTELVFGLDMSDDVTPASFERQRAALLSLLEDVAVSESNCPTGARVAVVAYSTYTKYLIRFQDYRRKKQLLESVKNIALERTSNKRHLGAAMRFVGQNVFKRVRAGMMMRKVAVFLSGGRTQDVDNIVTAVMEYRALNIVPAVISLENAPAIGRALEVDDSGNSIFSVLGRDMAANLRKVKNCAICYDPCSRAAECTSVQEPLPPQEVDADLVLLLDSSREMQADEYTGAQQLLGSVVEQLAVSSQPRRAGKQARVAVVQQSGTQAPKVEFGLQAYQNHSGMRTHLIQNMQQQGGSSALGQTLEFTLNELLLKAPQPRRRKVLLAVVGTQTADSDRAKLQYISQKAKCEGVAVFVATVGDRYSRAQVEALASPPVQQHLIHLGRPMADEQGYAQRFFRVFLCALTRGLNSYPPPSSRQRCDQLKGQAGGQGPAGGQVFFSGQEQGAWPEEEFADEAKEKFQETRRRTQSGQLDVLQRLSTGEGHTLITGGNARCRLDADAGSQCDDFVRVWFFDRLLGACSPFWFGGCGGNANRFNTENECLQTCATDNPSHLTPPQLHSFVSKDACFLGQNPGSCQDYTMMWFFDTEQNECSRFWFGGCGGNENRFKTQDECENLCLTKSR